MSTGAEARGASPLSRALTVGRTEPPTLTPHVLDARTHIPHPFDHGYTEIRAIRTASRPPVFVVEELDFLPITGGNEVYAYTSDTPVRRRATAGTIGDALQEGVDGYADRHADHYYKDTPTGRAARMRENTTIVEKRII